MIFGILFILAFIIGWLTHLFSNKWQLAIAVPSFLYLLNTLLDSQANWPLVIMLGLPLVAVGGLLGAYVIEIRRADDLDEPLSHSQVSDLEEAKHE